MEFLKSNVTWGMDLVEKYPIVFLENLEDLKKYAAYNGDISADQLVSLRYGFECREGWRELIEDLASTANSLVKYLRENGHPTASIRSCIVKEKFGSLRWQGDSDLPEPFDKLWSSYYHAIENKSTRICEYTGKDGKVRFTKGGKPCWVRTLCDEKAIELGYDIKDQDENPFGY